MLLNCSAGKDSWRVPWTSKRWKSVLNIHWKAWCWSSDMWPLDSKSWLIGNDPDDGKDWGHEEKRVTEGEMVGWHHWLNGYELKQTPGDREGQGSLVCCSPWRRNESDTTEQLNNNKRNLKFRKPQSFIMSCKQINPTFVPAGDIIFIILDSKQIHPLVQREMLSLSWEYSLYKHLWKIMQNKKCPH